jgi:hypothetical protein
LTAGWLNTRFTENTKRFSQIIIDRWPRLKNRVYYLNSRVEDIDLNPDDIAVSVHACGRLTDTIIETAVNAGARLAVLPCCHDTKMGDLGGLGGWVDGPLAIDVTRAALLRAKGYAVITRTIPDEITPKNRLLMAHPKLMKLPAASGRGIRKCNQKVIAGYGCQQPQRDSGISAGCHLSPLGCHHET